MDKALMPFRRYFDFAGRSTRTEYFAFSVLNLVIYMALGILLLMGMPRQGEEMSGLGILAIGLIAIYWIVAFFPSLAVTARRFHDQDRSAWMMLLGAIPYVGGVVLLVFMCLSGTKGDNRFGADPRHL